MCMGCNECNANSKKVVRATASVSGANLILTLPDMDTIINGDIIHFCIINAVDQTNPTGTVTVAVNGASFTLLSRYGNDLRIDQLKSRKIYTVGVGAQTPTMVMLSCVPETTFSFPTYSA